ncbi:MAG: HD domain-containing protein [Syntrophomonadaceae bacterium]|nr:HD domain-containing protein [Syntrophomonadaceae bacterium]
MPLKDIWIDKLDEIQGDNAKNEAVWESEERYRQLVEVSPDAIVVHIHGSIVFINQAGADLIGVKNAQAVIGNPITDFIHTDSMPAYYDLSKNLHSTGNFPLTEMKLIKHDGAIVFTEVVGASSMFQGSHSVQVIVRNITARKLAEENLQRSLEQLQNVLEGTVNALATTTEKKDPYTAGHQRRVASLACHIATQMGFTDEQVKIIRTASILHDIGKLQIPTDILSKPGRLSEMEALLVKTHSQAGYEIVNSIPFSGSVASILLQHHERLDGSGYPLGLKGSEILMEARILAVADVVEAMASHRPYRPALGIDRALDEIRQGAGTIYDSSVVETCLKIFSNNEFEFE